MELAWIYLIVAGLLEPCWVIALGKSEKLRNVKWTFILIVTMAASMYLLSIAMASLPVGISYSAWTGIGAVGALIAGILLYKEPVSRVRILFIFMIVAGIVGLHLTMEGTL